MLKAVKFLLIAVLALTAPIAAWGQSVQQSGSVTVNHIPRWISSGVIGDAGSGTNPFSTSFGWFANGGLPGCVIASTIPRANFDPNSSPHQDLCLRNTQGGIGGFTLNSYNGASAGNFSININGTEYPFPAGGAGTGNVTGPGSSTVGDYACWNNTSGTLLSDCGLGLQHVASNTALKATAGTAGQTIIRDGFTTAGDAPAVYYVFSASSCSLNSGSGDNGTQVKPNSGGGCWNATFTGPIDVREFGATCDGSTLDNDAFNNAALPALPLFIPAGKTCALVDWQTSTVPAIYGVIGQSTLTLGSTGGTSDPVVWYEGAGPFTLEGVNLTCPLYDPTTGAAPNGKYGLLIQDNSGFTSQATILHVRTKGCQNGLVAAKVQDFYMDDMLNDRPQAFGWIVTDQQDTLTQNTQRITIRNTRGYGAGQYCGSLPVSLPISGAVLSPRIIDVRGVQCGNSGLYASKLCFDLTGSSASDIYFEGMGINCLQGGIESKSAGENTSAIPNAFSDINIKFTYYSNIDSAYGISLPYEFTSSIPDRHTRYNVESYTTFVNPDACSSNTFYTFPASVTNGGNTYLLVTPGTTNDCTSITGTGTGIQDGTSAWNYFGATPSTPNNIGCIQVEAITQLTAKCVAHNTAFGYSIIPRGSSDSTIKQANLYFSGETVNACLDTTSGVTGTIDQLRLINWACRSASGFGALNFDVADTFTNFEIDGGSFINSNGPAFLNQAASIAGNIQGSPRFTGTTGGFSLSAGTTNLHWTGGGLIEVTSGSGASAIRASGTSAAGTITLDTPVSITTAVSANSANYPGYQILSSSPATVTARFVRGYATVSPVSTACNYGDVFLNSVPGANGATNGWTCTTPSTSSGTWTAY